MDFDPRDYWERRLGPADLSAVGYQGLGLGYNRWLYRVRRHLFARELGHLDVDWMGRRVLDVGSGTGFYIAQWLRLGAAITGSDLTNSAIQTLSATFPETPFVRFDLADSPPFQAQSFEAISAFDVLFHIVDDDRYQAALRNVSLLLKPGGYFVFSENFVRGSAVRDIHVVSRSLHEIHARLDDVGLEIVTRRPMFVLMNVPIDSGSKTLHAYWRSLERGLVRFPALGGTVGSLLYPIERALVFVMREGPSTELMICRRRARSGEGTC